MKHKLIDKSKSSLKRFAPMFLILLLSVIIFSFFRDYISLDSLRTYHKILALETQEHYLLAVFLYMLIYIVITATSFPAAALFTITGGFLFGSAWGSLYVVLSATVGATILFFAAKTAFADALAKKAGGGLSKFKKGFQNGAFSYLLILRLVPLFPFWLVNIVPALLNVSARTFIIATFIGIIPGAFVYASVGSGLATTFAHGENPNLAMIFKPEILLPILGLAVLALIPIIYKKFKRIKD